MVSRTSFLLSLSTLVYVFTPIAAANAEFYATQGSAGDILVVDEAGAPVSVVVGDPVGTRAATCPDDAYYIVTLPTDSSKLVLTDCATDTEQRAVEIRN